LDQERPITGGRNHLFKNDLKPEWDCICRNINSKKHFHLVKETLGKRKPEVESRTVRHYWSSLSDS